MPPAGFEPETRFWPSDQCMYPSPSSICLCTPVVTQRRTVVVPTHCKGVNNEVRLLALCLDISPWRQRAELGHQRRDITGARPLNADTFPNSIRPQDGNQIRHYDMLRARCRLGEVLRAVGTRQVPRRHGTTISWTAPCRPPRPSPSKILSTRLRPRTNPLCAPRVSLHMLTRISVACFDKATSECHRRRLFVTSTPSQGRRPSHSSELWCRP